MTKYRQFNYIMIDNTSERDQGQVLKCELTNKTTIMMRCPKHNRPRPI